MSNPTSAEARLEERLQALFRDKLNLDVPTAETDLLETGLLDSLRVVDLLLYIERDLGRSLPMEELELEDFRTFATIARCVERKGRVIAPEARPSPSPQKLSHHSPSRRDRNASP